MTTPAVIDSSSATVTAESGYTTVVQEYTNIRVQFVNPVPLNIGTIVTVVFPAQFSFDSRLTQVQAYGLFGTIQSLSFTENPTQLSIKMPGGITAYKAAGIIGIMIFEQVYNPDYVATTDSFSIYLTDSQGYQIAQVTSGITYIPSFGSIDNISLTPTSYIVNENTNLTLTFTPQHDLSSASLINITMPDNLGVNCLGFTYSGAVTGTPTCSYSGTSGSNFTFSNLFGNQGYTYSANNYISLTFKNVVNPSSAQNISILTIETFDQVGQNSYPVDMYQDTGSTTLFTVQPSTFLAQKISVSTNQTYTTATFTISVLTNNPVPSNGLIQIIIPSDVSIISNTGIICKAITSLSSALSCSLSNRTITISNGFTAILPRLSNITFSLSGLRSPISTKTSDSFQIFTTDSNGYIIDEVTSYLTVTMLFGMTLESVQVLSSSNVVAGSAIISVTFTPPVPLSNGQQITVNIPSEVTPPTKNGFDCYGSNDLSYSLSCSISGSIFTAIVNLVSSPSTANSSIITVNFGYAQNPPSTKPSSQFKVIVNDAYGYTISQSNSSSGGTLQVGTPSAITNATMTALDYRQEAYTTITIQFLTNNMIPAGGYVVVSFNPAFFQITQDNTTTCTSNLVKNENVSCPFLNWGSFEVENLFPANFAGGQEVEFTINNVFIAVNSYGYTTSWTVTTYTPDGYKIDTVQNVLRLYFPCNTPCLTCDKNIQSLCLSCNTATNFTILYNDNCWKQCPGSLYYDPQDLICKPCNSTCKTCGFYTPNQCTSCDIYSNYPYLSGNLCTTSCESGYFANNATAQCDQCSSDCLTCDGTASNCTSCNPQSSNKYLSNGRCVSSCPSGQTITNDSPNVCINCDSNCNSCANSVIHCTSCKNPLILSLYDNTCVSSCPSGYTIYNPSTNICDACDQKCNTCSGKLTFCTSCAENLYLQSKSGACVGQCANDNKLVGYNGICTSCSSSCVTCIANPNSCLSCQSNQYLYNYTCISGCPTGYEPDTNRQCVINGLQCPFGYQSNPLGTACELKAQACQPGFVLNVSKDRCIPEPGNYVPFPLCFACIFMAFIIFISWLKYKTTLISTNVIAAMSLVETIGILMQLILSYQMGVYSTFALTLISALFLYGSNLFFTAVLLQNEGKFRQRLYIIRNVSMDSAFKYWSLSYKSTYGTIVVLGSIANFKVYRFIYGRFFNLDSFNAAFDDPEHFFKPFTFISVFSLVTTMLPLLVANIVGMVFIRFGYQVEMTCIELTIIELVMLALMIYEKIKLKPKVMKQQQYYKIEPKMLDHSQVNVMSSLIDDPMYESTKMPLALKKRTSKTKGQDENLLTSSMKWVEDKQAKTKRPEIQEYYERRRMLERMISQIYSKDSTMPGKSDATVDLIQKLQEEEIMRLQERNCRSFRDLREVDEDFADADAADPELQNFISAPVSPREKEMLHNPFFLGRVGEFKKAVKQRDFYDNVYAEGKPAHYFPMRDTKLISVKVQTNLLELLAIDDMARVRTSRIGRHDSPHEEYVEENLDQDYTQGLINNVLEGFADHTFRKQRRRLPKNRLAQIPNFDLTDITGDFELDDGGNNLIVRDKEGALKDREGRRVNRNGYILDNEGNIITRRGVLIFRRDEVDSDEEIPAPFCFEKKLESLFKIEGIGAYSKRIQKKAIQDKEDELEKEYRLLKEKNASNHSSVDSLMGETPSKYAKKNKRIMPGDDDGFLSKIVQPMKAKTKEELLSQGGHQSRNLGTKKGVPSLQTSDSKKPLGRTQATDNVMQPTLQRHQQVQSTSMEGYDTSYPVEEQSPRDLFFSAITGLQGSRTRGHFEGSQMVGGDTQSVMRARQSQDLTNQKFEKLNQLKESLGTNEEDKALMKHLAQFEASLLGRNSTQEPKKKNLAKKNLQRVYGRVQDKLNEFIDFHQPKPKTKFGGRGANLFEEESMGALSRMDNTTLLTRGGSKRPPTGLQDSRLKNLENIYMKSLNQERRTASQMNRRGPQPVQSAWDIDYSSGDQTTAKHRPIMQHSLQDTGVESSDQDEARIRKQIDKMNAIINTKNKTQAMPKAALRPKNAILDGGWL